VFTEALSMGIGSLLTEQSVAEFKKHKDVSFTSSIPGAVVMFVSYLVSGMLPIAPYVFLSFPQNIILSIIVSLAGLGLLGAINARVAKIPLGNSIKRMVLLGGIVTIAGVIIGILLKNVS
jgi:VIT1/CCC1 family predicted Fe2+/Mn2+ transporter